MANLMTIKLNKNAGASWGFRLQGGKDFATPLCIQKVNGGSVAEHAGLQAGDSIVSINGHDALALRHKEAQDTIMKAGNNFDLVIQRGSCIWRPNVTALPEKTTLPDGIPVATKTSLAANQKPVRYVGSNHNCLPRPFPGAFNNDVPSATLKTVSAPTSKVQNGQSHSSPAYDKATVTNGFHSTPEPFSNAGKDGCESKNSSTSFPHFGIDEATSVLTISGTDVSLDKENARNFLMMTLDKENVNTLNLLQNSSKLPQTIPKTNGSSFRSHSIHNLQPTFSGTSRSASSSSVGSTHDLLGRGFRKHSFGSNCSSVSSASSHDGDSESSNHSQKDAPRPIGSGHNTVAAPFGEGKLVNVQYNTPLNLYSEDSIAETLSAQAEVLDKGVLGVNFMKNDKSYDGRASDVLRMVQEMDNEPQCETPGTPTNILGTLDRPVVHGYSFKLLQRALDDEVTPPTQGFPSGQIAHGGPGGEHHAGENICSACQRLIVGVFVRIKNKNLHAECFKCSTCGSSLKNVGYYNISDKLYCDIHAKQAARTHPPAPNLEPVTIQPGAAPPPGAISLPQASKMKIPVAFQHDKEHAPAPVLAPDPAPAPVPFKSPLGGIRLTPTSPSALNTPTPYKPEPEVPEPVPQEIPEPAPEPVTEPIFVPEPELEVAPQPQVAPLHVDEVVEAPPILPPIEMEGPPQEETLPPLQEPCESPIEEIKVETEYKPVENGFIEEAPMPEPVLQPVQEREPIVESPKCNAEEVAKVDFEAEGAVEPEEPTKELPITNQVEEPLLSPPEEGVWGIEKPASFEPEQNHFPVEDVPEPALPEAVPEVKESEFKLEPTFAFELKMPDLEAIFKPVAPEAIFKPVAPEAIFKLEEPAAVTEPLFEPKGTLFGTEGVSNSFSQFHSEESRFVETRYSSSSSVVQKSFVGDAAFERSPVPAPAPHKPFAPAPAPAPAPVAAAPMKPAPAPAFHSAANPQGFGAPAGDVNVRSHIPRKGTVNAASSQGSETPTCHVCHAEMRGPFVSALGKTWCPDHFVCATSTCKKNLIDMGFVEEQGELYCEHCYESYLAPICGKCDKRVKGDCLNAVGKQFHPECFCCAYCGKVFGSGAFYLEDGLPYCETDWNELFTTKCVGCNFPIEAGDRWVEALNNNYHSQCFKCSKCHKNLEGQSFFAKGGKPFCKIHAQRGF